MNNNPIGVFDSGMGGVSVVNEIIKLLPNESIIYLKDEVNFPYGEKTSDEIRKISEANVKWLLSKGAKLIVVACNTATVNAINYLRDKFPKTSFVGMEPAVKPASKIAKKGIIILSSPKATKSKQLNSLIRTFAKDIKVFNLGSLQLVRAVEEKWSKERINKLLSRTLSQRILDKSDALVLGCTHFPLIKDKIQKYVGNNITIIDSGEAVARRVKYLLKENKQLSADGKAKYECYSSKNLNRKQKNSF